MRLIDADALVNEFNKAQVEFDEYYKGLGRAKVITDNAPTVETSKIEYKAYNEGFKDGVEQGIRLSDRPQGEWIRSGKTTFFCSECGREINTKPFTRPDNYPFCHCGAQMKGGAE